MLKEKAKSSQILFCSTWQEAGKRSHIAFVGNRKDAQKGRMTEMFDFQSLYASLMSLCFLGRRLGLE